MGEKSSSKTASFPILGLLGIAFIVLKLCHVIDWSWWWITAPFWGGIAVALAFLAVVGLAALFVTILDKD
jgi:hypothetical protein